MGVSALVVHLDEEPFVPPSVPVSEPGPDEDGRR